MSSYSQQKISKVTTAHLQTMKDAGEKIACITAYDYTMARLVDAAGIDHIKGALVFVHFAGESKNEQQRDQAKE